MVVVTLLGPEHVFWESLSLNEDFFGSAGTALSPALHPWGLQTLSITWAGRNTGYGFRPSPRRLLFFSVSQNETWRALDLCIPRLSYSPVFTSCRCLPILLCFWIQQTLLGMDILGQVAYSWQRCRVRKRAESLSLWNSPPSNGTHSSRVAGQNEVQIPTFRSL